MQTFRVRLESTAVRRNALTIGAAALPLAIATWYYVSRWFREFPIVEFRSRLWSPLTFAWFWRNLAFQADNITFHSLGTGLMADRSIGVVCGQGIECVNSFPIAFVLASGLLLFILILRLFGSRLLAMSASGIWLFCLPVFDTMGLAATFDQISARRSSVGEGEEWHRALGSTNGCCGLAYLNGIGTKRGHTRRPAASPTP